VLNKKVLLFKYCAIDRLSAKNTYIIFLITILMQQNLFFMLGLFRRRFLKILGFLSDIHVLHQ